MTDQHKVTPGTKRTVRVTGLATKHGGMSGEFEAEAVAYTEVSDSYKQPLLVETWRQKGMCLHVLHATEPHQDGAKAMAFIYDPSELEGKQWRYILLSSVKYLDANYKLSSPQFQVQRRIASLHELTMKTVAQAATNSALEI